MNFNLYLFGKNKGTYNQYPDDYTSSLLSSLCSDVESSKAMIVRDQNLMHYIYAENLGNSNIIGVCLIFNKAYIKYVSKIFNFLRSLIEATLLKQGKIIKYNSSGDIEFISLNLSDDIKSYDYIKALVNSKFDSENNYFGVSELTTTYNGLHNSEVVDGNIANSEILKLQQKFNKIIIDYKRGIEEDLTKKVITGLQSQISDLNQKIYSQSQEITKLEKAKKQYKKVMFLFIVVLCCCGGLYFLYTTLDETERNLQNTTARLNTATDSIGVLKNTIAQKQNTIFSLNNEVREERMQKEAVQSKLENILSNYPFIVTSCEVNADRIDFDYYCEEEKEITVTLKAINSREIVSNSHTLTYYNGGGSKSLYFNKRLNTSQYYYVVIIYDGHIIAGKRW